MNENDHQITRALIAVLAPLALIVLLIVTLATTAQSAGASDQVRSDQIDQTFTLVITEPQHVPSPDVPPPDVPLMPSSPQLPRWASQLVPAANSDLGLVLSAATEVVNGDRITYTLTIANHGSVRLEDTLIVDVLPKAEDKYILVDVECSDNCGRVYEEAIIREPLGGTVLVTATRQVSWTLGILETGQSVQRQFSGQVIGLADGTTFNNIVYGYNYAEGIASTSNVVQTTVRVPRSQGGKADLSAAPTWLSADLGGTMSMDWGDFDQDGDLDLVLGSTAGTTVYRNEQGRLQIFWQNDLYTLGTRWANVNGDEKLELVTVGQSEDNTAVTQGRNHVYRIESGTFITDHTFLSDYQLVRVEAADLTNNGKIDLIASTNSINSWCPTRLYGNWYDRFYEWDYACIGNKATADVSPVDYDNDGDVDLITGEFPNRIKLWINGGYPNYWYPFTGTLDIRGLSFLPYDFAWGDYDGDGDLDLAAAFPLDRKARVYKNEGNELLFERDFRTTLFRTPLDVEWADFDGDGWLDLAVADVPPRIHLNTGGSFPLEKDDSLEAGAVKGQIWSMTSADHDLDSDVDLALANRDGASLLFTSFSSFLDTTLNYTTSMRASSVAWADADGDGDLDLLYGGSLDVLSENARLYTNQGTTFDGGHSFDFSGFGPRYVAWGDVDYDNDLDIALSTVSVVRIYVNGAGLWTNYDLDTSSYNIAALAWADAETDGDLDLLVARDGPNALYLNQDGPLDTTPYWTSPERDNTSSVAWGDVDGDLYLDIAVGNQGTPNRIYHNNQDNTFSLAWSAPTSYDTRSVAWADVDGDGDLDLAVGNYGAVNLIYENVDGEFGNTAIWQSTTEISQTTSVAFGDWDNDGDLDLAVGNEDQPDQVYENQGSFDLLWAWHSSEQYKTTAVAWGDRDSDGDLDLAVSRNGSDQSGVYLNSYVYPSHLYGGTGPLPNNPSYLTIDRPGQTHNAYSYSSAEILASPSAPTVEINYKVYDAEDDHITGTTYWFSLDGGGTWQEATPATSTITSTQALSTGQDMVFYWDAQEDEAIGDNARFRIEIVHLNSLGPVQEATTSATSPPFRLKATTCNWPERPEIQFNPTHPDPGEIVYLEGTIQPGTGSDQVVFTWDFGDGSDPVDGQDVQHIFAQPGVFQVRLTVTSAPCPIQKTLVTVKEITVGSGVPPVFLPLVMRSWEGN